MNANEISPMAKPRLNRIQKASVVLRAFFLTTAVLAGVGGVVEIIFALVSHRGIDPAVRPGAFWGGATTLTWAVGLWLGYRLFKFFADGDLFSPRIVGCLKQIGGVGILIAVVGRIALLVQLTHLHPSPDELATLTPFFVLKLFFSVIPGFAIICFAWIMDEGRKIQEEQELTV